MSNLNDETPPIINDASLQEQRSKRAIKKEISRVLMSMHGNGNSELDTRIEKVYSELNEGVALDTQSGDYQLHLSKYSGHKNGHVVMSSVIGHRVSAFEKALETAISKTGLKFLNGRHMDDQVNITHGHFVYDSTATEINSSHGNGAVDLSASYAKGRLASGYCMAILDTGHPDVSKANRGKLLLDDFINAKPARQGILGF